VRALARTPFLLYWIYLGCVILSGILVRVLLSSLSISISLEMAISSVTKFLLDFCCGSVNVKGGGDVQCIESCRR